MHQHTLGDQQLGKKDLGVLVGDKLNPEPVMSPWAKQRSVLQQEQHHEQAEGGHYSFLKKSQYISIYYIRIYHAFQIHKFFIQLFSLKFFVLQL